MGKWLSFIARHLHRVEPAVFEAKPTDVIPLDLIASLGMAKYSPQEIAAAVIPNTNKRFVVHVEYETDDGKITQTRAALSMPKSVNLRAIKRVFISATGGHSARRTRQGSPLNPNRNWCSHACYTYPIKC